QLLSAGKHVLAEKPLGRSAAEAYEFAAAADTAQRVHSVGFSWRRLGAVEAIAQLVKSGAIGSVWHTSAWYLTDHAATAATPPAGPSSRRARARSRAAPPTTQPRSSCSARSIRTRSRSPARTSTRRTR